ncbi:MAG: hypothetical protein AAFV53_00380 [Myxococcota bacterium]
MMQQQDLSDLQEMTEPIPFSEWLAGVLQKERARADLSLDEVSVSMGVPFSRLVDWHTGYPHCLPQMHLILQLLREEYQAPIRVLSEVQARFRRHLMEAR